MTTARPTTDDIQAALTALGADAPDKQSAARIADAYMSYATAHDASIARGAPWTPDEWLRQLLDKPPATR